MPHENGYLLPQVVNPGSTRCFQVEVPDDPEHISAFLAQIEQLSYWYTWERDQTKKGREVAAVWWDVYNAVRDSTCEGEVIRQSPTDPCIIQKSLDGVIWEDVVDMSLCVHSIYPPSNDAGRSQPGEQPGGGTPEPGQCFTNIYTVPGNGRALLPYPIHDGWTITVLEYTGAWCPDSSPLAAWFCPTGHQFLLGMCGVIALNATAGYPDPTGYQNELVLFTPDGTGHKLRPGEQYTVPVNMGYGNYSLQMNDTDLLNNQGSITAKVIVCNYQGNPCGVYNDFVVSSAGYYRDTVPNSELVYAVHGGNYVLGQGWLATTYSPGICCFIQEDFSEPVTLTGYRVKYTANGGFNEAVFVYDGTWHRMSQAVRSAGTDVEYDHHAFFNMPNCTKFAYQAVITPAGYAITIKKLEASCST